MKPVNHFLSTLSWKGNWVLGLLFILAILPAFAILFVILRYSVNVPFWDEWGTPGNLFISLQSGTLTLNDFLIQANESRPAFPRLIFLGLAYLFKWDIKSQLLVTLLAALLTSLNIYFLIRKTVSARPIPSLFLAIISNALIFSPVQYENWLWGIQLIVFMPILCITSIFVILLSRLNVGLKLLLGIILCTVSTFSYSNGIIAWVIILPTLIFHQGWLPTTRRVKLIGVWGLAFLTNLFVYFYDYQKPPRHPQFTEALLHPKQALLYFFAFLGSPLSKGDLDIAWVVGLLLCLIFAGLCLYSVKWGLRNRSFLDRNLIWMSIGLYSLLSAFIATLGRLGFGVEQSMSPRYTTFSLYFTVALVQMLAIAVQDMQQNPHRISKLMGNSNEINPQTIPTIFFTSVVTAILVLNVLSFGHGIQASEITWRTRLYSKACLTYVDYLDDSCILKSLLPSAESLRARAKTLRSSPLVDLGLAETATVPRGKQDNLKPKDYGFLDDWSQKKDGYSASGWAILPKREQPADAVLLTYRQEQQPAIVFAVAPVKDARNDVAKKLNHEAYSNAGWTATFSTAKLPTGKLKIQAWAFDLETKQAYRLQGAHLLEK